MSSEHSDGNTTTSETRTEQALRASEMSYRRLFEAAQDGILILDVDTGRVTDVNPFLVKLLGYSHSEIVGQTVGELSPFKDIISNQVMLEQLQRDGYVRYEDLPLQARDGHKVAVEFVSNIYHAGSKKVIQCNIRDISKRKRAEHISSLLVAIVESSDDAIIGKDLNSTITSWNKGAEKIFGYKATEMVGASIMILIPPERRDDEQLILATVKRGESMKHFETLRRTKDGRLINVSVTVSPIKNAGGHAIGVSKVARDITQRKQAEEQLLWKTTLLEAQLDSSIDGILVVDPQGRRILQNRRLNELWKFPQDILDDKDDAPQIAFARNQTRNPQQFADKVAFLYEHPAESSHDEIELIDGTILDRNSAPVRNPAGKYYGRIWYFRDVTESRKMEQKLRQAQKMESIGQLAGGIAHDFNNILAAIVGNIYLIQTEAANNPAILEDLESISDATRRATDLVNQILTFSRKGRPEREPIALNNVVLEALKLLRAGMPATVRIKTELTRTPTVLANATAVHQLIMNLGTNAWQAMPDQTGVLKVEMVNLDVDVDFTKIHPDLRPGRYVQLSVSDTC
jgi:PAS domain S-box-containing protein